ncbi:MAG: putative oxidoreductase [Rickettsiales bacterium]|jgi:4-cresol dehydrogenase (hydroxylating)|nr:putative oxidoreductase [Rickettsiales bacterium]
MALHISEALNAWQDVLGSKGVSTDGTTLSQCENATFNTSNRVIAVLFPQNKTQIQACLRVANRYKVPIYPISKGKNWGYGSRVPASDQCAIISLERMNAILEYNEKLAYITVEPGVSFQQVYDFLNEKQSSLTPPSIGSTPQASLVGNALERGIGKGIYGDRFQHSCNMEIILPTGECIRTGFGGNDNCHSQHVYRWGVGPSIDGIFTQSNYGIVTKMTFWLVPKPKYFQIFFYTVKDNAQLEKTIEALRQLRLEGTLNTTSTLSNDYRVLAMKQQFPWEKGKNELPEGYIEAFRNRALMGNSWVGDDAIIAPTKAQGKARAKRVKQVLGKAVDRLVIIDNNFVRLARIFHKPVQWLTGVNMLELAYFFQNSLYLGIPMEKQLNICYWRKKTPAPTQIDLDRDKCGVIWCSPSIPFEGAHIKKVLEILETAYKEYQFEPNMGFNMMSDRNIACTSAIIYDREEPGEDQRAMECYNAMNKALAAEGYMPYRLGIQSMDKVYSDSEEYRDFLQRLKLAIDPNNILSPGHYGISGLAGSYAIAENKEFLLHEKQKEPEAA